MNPVREEEFELFCLLGADKGFKVLFARRLPGTVTATSETVSIDRERIERAHKNADGCPPEEGIGHANQKIPFPAHFRSTFLRTFVMFLFSEEVFLCT